MIRTMHLCAVTCALMGVAALAAIALNGSFLLVFVCLCFMTVAGYGLVAAQQKLRQRMERTGAALGKFMRGELQARTEPAASDDEFTRLQHRINNLLDVMDLHLRGPEAAIDLSKHAAYAENLRITGLSEALRVRADAPAEPKPREEGPSVGSFLQELRHQAGALLGENRDEPKTGTPEPTGIAREDILQLQRQSLQASQRLQQATNQLAQRAMQPMPAEKSPHGSFAHLEAGCARMAEQATVLSLNIAIEAGRAPADSPLHGATEALRTLAKQLQQWRMELGQYSEHGPASSGHTVATVPLSVAMEALTTAEQQLRAQHEALAVLVQESEESIRAEAA